MWIFSRRLRRWRRRMQQAALSRREIQVVWDCCSYCCFVVCLRKSARDIWGFFWVYWLSPLPCYSPADSADDADECSRLHYIAEKDRLVRLKLFCCFGFCLRKSARDIWGFFWVYWLSPLPCYSPADYADHAERNAASCIISQRKTDRWG